MIEGDDQYTAPFNVRFLDGESADDSVLIDGETAHVGAFDQAHYTAVDIVRLLGQAHLRRDGQLHPLSPSDIAVLVRTNRQGQSIAAALADLGVPASLTGQLSVWQSSAAAGVIDWLKAIENPGSTSAAKSAAATPLFGWTAREFLLLETDNAVKKQWARWCSTIREWRVRFDRSGFFAAFQTAMKTYGVMTRLMALPDADRMVTDLLHVVDLLHDAQSKQRLSLAGLVRYAQSPGRTNAEKEGALLRLERDAAAVRILTMHASKGLEFPVVYVPYLYANAPSKPLHKRPHWIFPDPNNWQDRHLELRAPREADIQGTLPFAEANRLHERANMQEALRLLYVAMTRAKHRCVIYDAATKSLEGSALSYVFHRPGPGRLDDGQRRDRLAYESRAVNTMDSSALLQDLLGWVPVLGQVGGRPVMGVRPCRPTDMVGIQKVPPMEAGHPLERRVFGRTRRLERHWRRHSYSSLTRNAHGDAAPTDGFSTVMPALEGGAVSGQDTSFGDPITDRGIDEQMALSEAEQMQLDRTMPAPPPMMGEDPLIILQTFPAGTEPGSCLHAILEDIDFEPVKEPASQLTSLGALVTDTLTTYGLSPERFGDEVVSGLAAAIRTPLRLPGCAPGFSLAHLPLNRRFNEWQFTLPLAGGHGYRVFGRTKTEARGPISRAAIVDAFRLGQGEGLLTKAYVESLERLPFGVLAGFLVGSIDLVFSVDQPNGQPLFFLADYKSNRLDLRRARIHTVSHFHPEWMAHEMRHHHYVVQSHLYALALHRFLRLRLGDGYRYDLHFGGAAYLFLRGMIGPETPTTPDDQTFGVHFEKPNEAVIEALDVLFDQSVVEAT
ncbi:MAG: 3'-5' exonuclease [Myxococcota bacterium]|nr:3'-5' exonuclease [Myxococcota bacterium]